jgi:hypothetical protein
VERCAAHELNVKVAHAQGSGGRFPDRGKGLGEEIVERFAVLVAGPEPIRFFTQFSIGESFE